MILSSYDYNVDKQFVLLKLVSESGHGIGMIKYAVHFFVICLMKCIYVRSSSCMHEHVTHTHTHTPHKSGAGSWQVHVSRR